VRDPDAVICPKESIKFQSDGKYTYFYADYTGGLYTYEMSDSIYAVFYFVEGNGSRQYTKVSRHNLVELLNRRKDDTEGFSEYERAVYTAMSQLETDITEYREGKTDSTTIMGQKLRNDSLRAPSNETQYTFGNLAQIVLIEPWGLQINAVVVPQGSTNVNDHLDYSSMEDYGMVMFYDVNKEITDATQLDSFEEMQALVDKAYVFSKEDGSAFINPGNGAYFTARYNQDVFTYQLDTDLYVMYYVVIDGNAYYSDIRTFNVYDLATRRSQDSSFDVLEQNVYKDMVSMCDAITAYRKDYFERHPEQ
jgi:hypothetical protein